MTNKAISDIELDKLVAFLDQEMTSKGTGHINLEVNKELNNIVEDKGMGVCGPNSACQIPNLNVGNLEEE